MSVKKKDIIEALKNSGLNYTEIENGARLAIRTEKYKNHATNDNYLGFEMESVGDGGVLRISCPYALDAKSAGVHVDAFLVSCMQLQVKSLFKFEYDENDGEVKPTAEIPVGEKEKLTVEEIMTPMQAILHELDEWYDALEEVKETGKIIE